MKEKEYIEQLKQLRMNKKFWIATIIISIFCFITLVYEMVGLILIKTRYIMPEISYNYEDYVYVNQKLRYEYFNTNVDVLTVEEIDKQASKDIPLFYCVKVDRPNWLMGDKSGTCSILVGLIRIDNSLDPINYAKVLVHERLHLYYYTACERFTQYQTFKFLYESDNPFFHKAGIEIARDILANRYPENYNCTGQIIEYFMERG